MQKRAGHSGSPFLSVRRQRFVICHNWPPQTTWGNLAGLAVRKRTTCPTAWQPQSRFV